MAVSAIKHIEISGCVAVLPPDQFDNLQLDYLSELDKQDFVKHTGIRYRRKAKSSETIIDYFERGINQLLEGLNWDKKEIQILICVTQTPDKAFPTTANTLQSRLNLNTTCICYDINLGCSGFVYGLHTISALLQSIEGFGLKAILCTGDFSSEVILQGDRTTEPIFSDAIAVTGIQKWKTSNSMFFNLETYENGIDAIYFDKQMNAMKLNGIDVFQNAVTYVPKNIRELATHARLEINQIDAFILHQANKLINDSIGKKLRVSNTKTPSSLELYGNTSSASIPITFISNYKHNIEGSLFCFCGFGVGFSIGTVITKITKIQYSKLIEY